MSLILGNQNTNRVTQIHSSLMEASSIVKDTTGLDLRIPADYSAMLTDDEAFKMYMNTLIDTADNNTDAVLKGEMMMIAQNVRQKLLESSMFNLNPYENMSLPIIPIYYPKMTARQAVTVTPMDSPITVKSFAVATLTKNGVKYEAPVLDQDFSAGPKIGYAADYNVAVPGTHDLLAPLGLDQTTAHINRNFKIVKLIDTAGPTSKDVLIKPTVDGNIFGQVDFGSGSQNIIGHIDYLTGVLTLATDGTQIATAVIQATVSTEENTIAPEVEFTVIKKIIEVSDRAITTKFSAELQRDIKALWDIDYQSQILSIISEQIMLDIEGQIIGSLLTMAERLAPASHRDVFQVEPQGGYTHGPKPWLSNIFIPIEKLSSRVYHSTRIAEANIILYNPLDGHVLTNLGLFGYSGDIPNGGNAGPVGRVVANKYLLLPSFKIPEKKLLMVMKQPEEVKATYLWCPYAPGLVLPFPLGNKPSMTVKSINGELPIREKGTALLELDYPTSAYY